MKPLVPNLSRPRLRDALLQADCRLRLLRAPAGSGKTALLDECLRHCPQGTALVRLDLDGWPLTAGALCAALGEGLGLPDADRETLLDALETHPQPLWLVLDGYPHLPDGELDRLLNELVLLSSPRVRWWLTSRRRPRLQLARMLLDGELCELQGAELAFSAGELDELLGLLDLDVPEAPRRSLLKRSAGWCAGLRLQLPALQPAPVRPADSAAVLLEEYLRCEVFDGLPTAWQMGLSSLAHLTRFDHELCEQLLGVGEGAQLLDSLLECGLFIEPLDRRGKLFRIQPLLAPILAGLLPRSLVRPLYCKACQWFLGQGQVRQAVTYALKAGQHEMAVVLLQQLDVECLLQGNAGALLFEWQRALPEELLLSTPRLVLLNAWASLLGGRLADGQRYMAALQRHLPQGEARHQHALLAQYAALQAALAMLRGDDGCSDEQLAALIEALPESSWHQGLICQLLRIERWLRLGELDAARALTRHGLLQARRRGSVVFESLFSLAHARMLGLRGELRRAGSLLARVQAALSEAWGDEANPICGRVSLHQGELLLQQGRSAEAQVMFREGIRGCRAGADPALVMGYLGLADLRAQDGAFNEAHRPIAKAERLMQSAGVSGCLYEALLLAGRARIALQQGRYRQAERILSSQSGSVAHPLLGSPELHLRLQALRLQAQMHGERVQGRSCLADLQRLHGEAQASGWRPLSCELGFMLAEGLQAEGDAVQARQRLLAALEQARQMGLARVARAFAQRRPDMLCWQVPGPSERVPVLRLSVREREVLQLISLGLSNQQIAAALRISSPTVKSHAWHINTKLGAARRTQAVARAKALGILAL